MKEQIALKLKEIRKSRKWSREKVSEKTQKVISAQRLGNYEYALRQPDLDAIKTLAEAYKVSVIDILPDEFLKQTTPSEIHDEPAQYASNNPDLDKLIKLCYKLPPHELKNAAYLIGLILNKPPGKQGKNHEA